MVRVKKFFIVIPMLKMNYCLALAADLAMLSQCTKTKTPPLDIVDRRAPMADLAPLQMDLLSCLQAVSTQGLRHWELLTLMLSLHCRHLCNNLGNNLVNNLGSDLGSDLGSGGVVVINVGKPRFTPELAFILKKNHPEAGLHHLVRLACSDYDCNPEEPILGIGFRDQLFNVLGPYAVHLTSVVEEVVVVDGMYRVFPINDSTPETAKLSSLFKQQLAYCLAYEYLFPSSNPRMAKYSKATAEQFYKSVHHL
jgi:hypothetical protein